MSRARRTLVSALALFALSQLAMNVAVDTVRPHWRDPEAAVRFAPLSRPDARPLVVALGSSRTQMGFDPDSLGPLPGSPRVLNLAQAGGRLPTQLVSLRRLHRAGVRPAVVLIEILPASLADARPFEARLELQTLSLCDLVAVMPECADPASAWRDWLGTRVAPVRQFRFHVISDCGGGHLLPSSARTDFHKKQTRPGGWMPYFFETVSPKKRAVSLAADRAHYGPLVAELAITCEARALLATIAREAEARGAAVAFVVPPESPEFRSWYGPGANLRLAELLRELRESWPVFDFRCAFEGGDFADGHHLLRHAAREYSRRLGACVGLGQGKSRGAGGE